MGLKEKGTHMHCSLSCSRNGRCYVQEPPPPPSSTPPHDVLAKFIISTHPALAPPCPQWLKRLYVGPQGAHALQQGDSSLVDRVREVSATVLCGGLAGTAMWAAVLPADVAKTRMQVALPGTARDLGLLSTLGSLARERRLYMGLTPTLVRAFPTNAAQWLTWELSVALLGRLQRAGDADARRPA